MIATLEHEVRSDLYLFGLTTIGATLLTVAQITLFAICWVGATPLAHLKELLFAQTLGMLATGAMATLVYGWRSNSTVVPRPFEEGAVPSWAFQAWIIRAMVLAGLVNHFALWIFKLPYETGDALNRLHHKQ